MRKHTHGSVARLAVITGDLIGSTSAVDPAAYRKRLHELLVTMEKTFDAQTSIFRGDGFQLAVDTSANIFRLALLIRSGLIARSDPQSRWDARLAIAFGKGLLKEADPNGEAFVNSGRTLDAIESDNMRVYCPSRIMELGTGVATAFVDDLINRLTPVEAETLFHYLLEGGSHQHIAERLGKQRPTVTLALQRAGYRLVERYIEDMGDFVRITHE